MGLLCSGSGCGALSILSLSSTGMDSYISPIPCVSSSFSVASIIGIIMAVAAVLEIHIETNMVTVTRPKLRRRGLQPTLKTMKINWRAHIYFFKF